MKRDGGKKLLAGKIENEIVDLIMNTPYRPEARLPNECDLALRLGVGRSTVREALKSLASQNVVDIRQGAGTFVRQNLGVVEDPFGFRFRKDRKRLAVELCEIRLMMEPEITAVAAKNATEEDVIIIQKLALEVALAYQKDEDHTDYDINFHLHIARATGNTIAPRIMSILCNTINVITEVTGVTEEGRKKFMPATLTNHEKIVNAIRDHKPAQARRAMQSHIEFNLKNISNL